MRSRRLHQPTLGKARKHARDEEDARPPGTMGAAARRMFGRLAREPSLDTLGATAPNNPIEKTVRLRRPWAHTAPPDAMSLALRPRASLLDTPGPPRGTRRRVVICVVVVVVVVVVVIVVVILLMPRTSWSHPLGKTSQSSRCLGLISCQNCCPKKKPRCGLVAEFWQHEI